MRSTAARFALAVAFLSAALAASTSTALADGDPASDFLVGTDVYLPFPAPSAETGRALLTQVASVYAAGYRIKVAVIATRSDLGSVTSLMGHPTVYAHFLGAELPSIYVGPLLIVMQSGFGIYDGGASTAAEERILRDMRVQGSRPDDLVRAATTAVATLLKSGALESRDHHAPLAYPQPSAGRRGQPMKLHYQVLEDSQRSSVIVKVLAPTQRLALIRVPLQHLKPRAPYSVTWNVPSALPDGPFRLCVSGRDASGNKGPWSCMAVQLD
jgi:hypothetical protein